MVIIDVKMLSGFIPVKTSVRNVCMGRSPPGISAPQPSGVQLPTTTT
uniref:Alpha-macroglobulin receptor-binding domain-containing protein n=1 Tax=Chelydra serpentina TaxID=8475 RepID=A0A8C3TDB2_CHESE